MLAHSAYSPHYWWVQLSGYGIFLALCIGDSFIGHQQAPLSLAIIYGVILIVVMIHSAHVDARRHKAFWQQAEAPTISIQPYDPAIFMPPLRMLWRPTWRGIATLIGIGCMLAAPLTIVFSLISKGKILFPSTDQGWGIALLESCLDVTLFAVLALYAIKPAFSAWDAGIAVGLYRSLDYSALLLWRDVKFFAVRATCKGKPTHYEVSGERRIITFGRLQPSSPEAFFFRPPMPLPEYDALMDDLIAYIAHRTKLPLINLTQVSSDAPHFR